ncbi:prepilin-type N-terminal cleavage/methylation domain-containing protein [Gemmatimonas aurantiaca]|uniref:prepilin-type N-terminal cleavage/methylation domain-containing protein n=1 Tax=Gemmatimonas aurantiaca TaxID=173480 RepID=UPI00301DA94B
MNRRSGFTLLEVAIALSLTAMAAGVAAGALWAARRTSEVQSRFATEEATGMRWRALLTDMLRHAPSAERVNEPLLTLRETEYGPELRFLSQGVVEPFGTGAIWAVVVREDRLGVLLEAEPLGIPSATMPDGTHTPALLARVPASGALQIELLEAAVGGAGVRNGVDNNARWRTDWPLAQMRPSAITIRWQDRRTGDPVVDRAASPFVLHLDAFVGAGVDR